MIIVCVFKCGFRRAFGLRVLLNAGLGEYDYWLTFIFRVERFRGLEGGSIC